MSEEGELKRRNRAIKIQSRLYHWSEIHKIQQLFDSWIDEARNFPSLTIDYPSEKDFLNWFVKWFGDKN